MLISAAWNSWMLIKRGTYNKALSQVRFFAPCFISTEGTIPFVHFVYSSLKNLQNFCTAKILNQIIEGFTKHNSAAFSAHSFFSYLRLSSGGTTAARDIVQFVPFRQFSHVSHSITLNQSLRLKCKTF